MQEYFVHFWGRDAQAAKRDLGLPGDALYFTDRTTFDDVCAKLRTYEWLVMTTEQGELTHRRTVAVALLRYRGKEYRVAQDCGLEYPVSAAQYMWLDGNYSCDCNRCLFIRDQCDPGFPDLECGEEIEMPRLLVVEVAEP